MTFQFYRNKKTEDIFAVHKDEEGRIIAASGPIPPAVFRKLLLPHFAYLPGLGEMVAASMDDWEPCDGPAGR